MQILAFPQTPETFRIKRMLDSEYQINEATLFADMDGLARYVGWRHKWGWLPLSRRGG
jgi:hypothetical protein